MIIVTHCLMIIIIIIIISFLAVGIGGRNREARGAIAP